jgi:hypothetical protein
VIRGGVHLAPVLFWAVQKSEIRRSNFDIGISGMAETFPGVLSGDPKEIQKAFNSLPVDQQLNIVLGARGKERLRALFFSHNPKELVQKLPELEIFLTVKEVGRSDAIDLVSLTTPEQFQYLLDLDLWKKDRLDPDKVVRWLEILLESGEERVVEFIRSSDLEFLCLLFITFLHITKFEGDPTELMDRNLPFTLDREYFITFRKAEIRPVFQPFLEILYRYDTDTYRRLMESLLSELESDIEETSYRFRNARLADYGFPDMEQALEIYRFVNPGTLPVEETPQVTVHDISEKTQPTFYLTAQGDGPFFSAVFSKVTDPLVRDRLREELAGLCNKAMVAESIDLLDIGDMEWVVKKVFHYLNLGLQGLSGEEEGKAVRILRTASLQKVFQAGMGATLLLRKKAETLLKGPWFEGDRKNLRFLDSIDKGTMEGVLKRKPGIYRNGVVDDFKNLQDLKEVEDVLDRIDVVVTTLREKLNMTPERAREQGWAAGDTEGGKDMSLSTFFLTALANRVLNGRFEIETLDKNRLQDLFSIIFENDGQGRGRLRMEIRRDMTEWLDSTEDDERKRQHLRAFWDFCVDVLEGDFGRIPPGEEIDPRFVRSLMIRASSVEGR